MAAVSGGREFNNSTMFLDRVILLRSLMFIGLVDHVWNTLCICPFSHIALTPRRTTRWLAYEHLRSP